MCVSGSLVPAVCKCILVAHFVEYCVDSKEILDLIPKEQTIIINELKKYKYEWK